MRVCQFRHPGIAVVRPPERAPRSIDPRDYPGSGETSSCHAREKTIGQGIACHGGTRRVHLVPNKAGRNARPRVACTRRPGCPPPRVHQAGKVPAPAVSRPARVGDEHAAAVPQQRRNRPSAQVQPPARQWPEQQWPNSAARSGWEEIGERLGADDWERRPAYGHR